MNAGLTTDFHDEDGELAYLLLCRRIAGPSAEVCLYCDAAVEWDAEDALVAAEHHVITCCLDCGDRARRALLINP